MSSEFTPPRFESPETAESAFYAAFESADTTAMMAVWADDPSINCIHPMGPSLRGTQAVGESWSQILAAPGAVRFVLSHQIVFRSGELSVHCVYENIHHGQRFEDLSVVIATNVYRHDGHGWRMIVHHASPGHSVRAEPAADLSAMH